MYAYIYFDCMWYLTDNNVCMDKQHMLMSVCAVRSTDSRLMRHVDRQQVGEAG